jgi:phosphopantetheinyl transferase
VVAATRVPASGTVRIVCRRGDEARRTSTELLADALGWRRDLLDVATTNGGKPYLTSPRSDLCFSVARTRDVALVAFASNAAVGVDVERLDRDVTGWTLWRHVLTEQEASGLPDAPAARNTALLQLWVRKEAVLKAAAVGLTIDPSKVELDAEGRLRALPSALGSPSEWSIVDVVVSGCAAAVATRPPTTSVEVLEARLDATGPSTSIRFRA